MAGSSLDPENAPEGRRPKKHLKGHDTKSLGPSDSSDSGSDLAAPGTDELVGDINMDDNSDRHGTQMLGSELKIEPILLDWLAEVTRPE